MMLLLLGIQAKVIALALLLTSQIPVWKRSAADAMFTTGYGYSVTSTGE